MPQWLISDCRFVVGWAMGKERDEQLITKAAGMALERRGPGVGLLHHSDRGSQGYQALLKQHGIEISMSGKGDCYDNALMESFFGTLKEECVERKRIKREQKLEMPFLNILKYFTIDREGIHH